ncbi:carbohydrate esterase family 4 protein [Tilletiaria anomala UBC 951]|uniref:chitin deacetylase n=1 Tax=Tilletiaria anomala (strain ATCC 24038 / CBS 436.72 / UBC 951) TaxID=1037660 RepID=A0A066VZ71_TILAU|nr:carbohydrate esterase family 4 protein [Tilletiaria anomala UBC 951]KDN46776.1 carbohydrate esterase family 4 protein [Tilletiaria anomala UBC 951]
MVKFSTGFALLTVVSGVAASSSSTKQPFNAIAEDLSYLFDTQVPGPDSARSVVQRHRAFQQRNKQARTRNDHLAKRQSVNPLPHSGTIPAAGGTSKNGKPYPPAGAIAPKRSTLPTAWVTRYQAKKEAGLIPDIPQSKLDEKTGTLKYPSSVDVSKVCSWTLTNCNDGDIWLSPQGKTAITFDDGPTQYSADLINFLTQEKQATTHFLIGSSILNQPDGMHALASHDLAQLGVHTFSHTLQTTKSDLQIVGDLGWTMQLIYEWTGKVPMYWRAPEGDLDARVRAIAKQVFGLQSVMWNRDADDWCLKDGGGSENSIHKCRTVTYDDVVAEYKAWAHNSSLEGTNTLMHETKDQTIKAFKEYYGFLKASKYKMGAVASIIGAPWYQNQMGPTDPVEEANSIIPQREAMNYTDGGLHTVGSAGGAALGDFSQLKTTTISPSSGSGSSAAGLNSGAAADGTSSNGSSGSASTSAAGRANGWMTVQVYALAGLSVGTASAALIFGL